MSLTTLQAPYFINATTNNLPLIVSSSNITNSQWRLVTEVYLPVSASALTTIKTFANDSGSAVVDIARICNDYLQYDTSVFQVPFATTGSGKTVGTFTIVMGEEYASSPSSSVVAYNGLGATGNPAFTMSFDSSYSGSSPLSESAINLYPAVNEYSNLSYNWPTSSYEANFAGTSSRPFLTNDPAFSLGIVNDTSTFNTSSVKKTFAYDFGTLSVLSNYPQIVDLQDVALTIYSGSTSVYSDNNYGTNGNVDGKLVHVGAYPANISASNATAGTIIQAGNWTSYTLDFEFVNGDNRLVRFDRQECSYYDRYTTTVAVRQFRFTKIKGRTRFAFINKYGVWDYYNIPYPVEKVAKISRKQYVKPQLNWQDITNTTASVSKPYRSDLFNEQSRGKDDYYTEYVDNYKITSDWLTVSQSNWLTELFDSPSVYIQNDLAAFQASTGAETFFYPGGFVPVNIKNASYTWRSNKKKQKTFQYDIEFELSKLNIGRR